MTCTGQENKIAEEMRLKETERNEGDDRLARKHKGKRSEPSEVY